MIDMKCRGRVTIPYYAIQEICGLTKKATKINSVFIDKETESINLDEIVTKGRKVTQGSSVISYELFARLLKLPEHVKIVGIDVKDKLMLNELQCVLITVSSVKPIQGYTWAIPEGGNIPHFQLDL